MSRTHVHADRFVLPVHITCVADERRGPSHRHTWPFPWLHAWAAAAGFRLHDAVVQLVRPHTERAVGAGRRRCRGGTLGRCYVATACVYGPHEPAQSAPSASNHKIPSRTPRRCLLSHSILRQTNKNSGAFVKQKHALLRAIDSNALTCDSSH